jgi:multiple sugar transport system permease protein
MSAAKGIFHKAGSLHAERRWALWTAYISLIFAAIIMLAPPFYMLVTSLKTSAEVRTSAAIPGSCAARRWRTTRH